MPVRTVLCMGVSSKSVGTTIVLSTMINDWTRGSSDGFESLCHLQLRKHMIDQEMGQLSMRVMRQMDERVSESVLWSAFVLSYPQLIAANCFAVFFFC